VTYAAIPRTAPEAEFSEFTCNIHVHAYSVA